MLSEPQEILPFSPNLPDLTNSLNSLGTPLPIQTLSSTMVVEEKTMGISLEFLKQAKRDGFIYVNTRTGLALGGRSGTRKITNVVRRIEDVIKEMKTNR